MKKRILLIATLVCCCIKLAAQTENYDPDGTYWGPEFKSINVDFTKAEIGVLPDPVVSEDIQELEYLGLIRFTIRSRPIVGESESVPVLFNHNPMIDGKNNTVSYACIYLPTLSEGAGAIRVEGWLGSQPMQVSRSLLLSYFDEASSSWKFMKNVSVPGDGTNKVEAEVGLEGVTRLKLEYKSGEYLSIRSIAVSAYGEGLPTSALTSVILENVRLSENVLYLNDEVADVYFYAFTGQQLLAEKNVSGEVLLPEGSGIVKVINNRGSIVLKKIQH